MNQSPARRRFGKALAFSLPALGIAGMTAAIVASGVAPSSLGAEVPEPALADVAPRSLVFGSEMSFLGLTPDSFAAAGVSADQVGQIVRLLAVDSGSGISEFQSARALHAKAQREYEDKAAFVRSGRGDRADAATVAEKRAFAAMCLADCRAAEENVMALVRGVLDDAQFAAITNIRANMKHSVALPYGVTELSESERIRLRDVLVMRRQWERDGTEMNDSDTAFLESIEGRMEVARAMDTMSSVSELRVAMRAALDSLDGE